MATFSGLAAVRDDFRCSICRQKSAFHCEHDTPCRDRLLGVYDAERFRFVTTNSRRNSQRKVSSKSKSGNEKYPNINHGTHINSNMSTQSQNYQQPTNRPLPNANTNIPSKQNERKKGKSCTIL